MDITIEDVSLKNFGSKVLKFQDVSTTICRITIEPAPGSSSHVAVEIEIRKADLRRLAKAS